MRCIVRLVEGWRCLETVTATWQQLESAQCNNFTCSSTLAQHHASVTEVGPVASPAFGIAVSVRDKILNITGTFKDWSKHFEDTDENAALSSLLVGKQEDLPFRRMKDSYVEVYLPLGTQPQLRKMYLNVFNCVRFGAILEDLDLIGVLIAYLHTKNEEYSRTPLLIITALVEKIVTPGGRRVRVAMWHHAVTPGGHAG
eukprot:gi/632983723/ref/XP_007908787.1/ PREDICTED: acyl-coenzyme A thioesterase 9, mitochondrial-like [Callorhinchus milii]